MKQQCGLCKRKNETCVWPKPGQERINKRHKKDFRFILYDTAGQLSFEEDHVNNELQFKMTELCTDELQLRNGRNSSVVPYLVVNSLSSPNNTNLSFMALDSFSEGYPLSPELLSFSDCYLLSSQDKLAGFSPIYQQLGIPWCLSLNGVEKEYMEYYCYFVAPTISVVSNEYNYFLKVFLPMALRDQSVLYSLIAWGCIFKCSNNFDYSTSKRNGASFLAIIKDALQSKQLDKAENFITSLATLIILICIEITTGDTAMWSRYLSNCYNLINRMGGFGVLKDYSGEGKALAESFAFFDILASQSNENGTYYPVQEYCDIVNLNNTGNYIDPLLGCTRPLILILGDVINLIVESQNIADLEASPSLSLERLHIFMDKVSKLEKRLFDARMLASDIQILSLTNDLNYHCEMFDLYKITILLYVKQAIRRFPPNVPEIRLDLYRMNRYLNRLLSSPLRLGLCFPLLIAGLSSVTVDDRNGIQDKIMILMQTYESETIRRIYRVLEEIWRINNTGLVCVDWFEITKKFGWKLNTGR